MDYSKFKHFLKNFLIAIWFLLFIILAILIIFKTEVSAETIQTIQFQGVNGSAFSQSDFNDIQLSFNNLKGNYNNYVCTLVPGNNAYLICFNYDSTNFVRARLSGENPNDLFNTIISNNSYTWSMYELIGGGRGNLILSNISTNFGVDYRFRFGFTNNLPWLCSNIPIYNYSNNNIYWAPDGFSTFTPPALYPNANDDQTALTSGQFTFFIINPR